MKQARRAQLQTRDQQYAEILKRRQEYEAELNAIAPSEGLGAAKGKGQYWGKRLRQAKRRKYEYNTKTCLSCLEPGGMPCRSKKTGARLPLTHTTYAKRRQEEARAKNPDFRPIALDETYDS